MARRCVARRCLCGASCEALVSARPKNPPPISKMALLVPVEFPISSFAGPGRRFPGPGGCLTRTRKNAPRTSKNAPRTSKILLVHGARRVLVAFKVAQHSFTFPRVDGGSVLASAAPARCTPLTISAHDPAQTSDHTFAPLTQGPPDAHTHTRTAHTPPLHRENPS